jgi:hypothetical protein
MAKRPLDIPSLTDEDLRQRLQPLADKVLPNKLPTHPSPPKKSRRKGMEFMLPEAVCFELKMRAARNDISATTLMLQILRDAGFPVEPNDFIDLRKLPRKAG